MRPKYPSSGIVLARYPHGEASATLAILTVEFGLLRVRAQGVRKQGAKLAPALQTLTECEAIFVRGKDGWRLSGAVLVENFARSLTRDQRDRAGRIAALILRLVRGEHPDPALFELYRDFLLALRELPEHLQEIAEIKAALHVLQGLGLDDGEVVSGEDMFKEKALEASLLTRRDFIVRINRGLSASGL